MKYVDDLGCSYYNLGGALEMYHKLYNEVSE